MGIPSGNKQLQMAGLNNLGSNDRGDQVTLSSTAETLVRMAGTLISEAQRNLKKSGSVATGELETSIKARDIAVDGSVLSIEIELLDRYAYTDEGVNGVEQSQGSRFSFRTIRPGRKMQQSIKRWMRTRTRRAVKYSPISKTEKKDRKVAALRKNYDTTEAAAWAVATSVKKKGIKATRFFSKAIKTTEQAFKKEIAAGYRIDIINSLNNLNNGA